MSLTADNRGVALPPANIWRPDQRRIPTSKGSTPSNPRTDNLRSDPDTLSHVPVSTELQEEGVDMSRGGSAARAQARLRKEGTTQRRSGAKGKVGGKNGNKRKPRRNGGRSA
jgi:hypothetical protein